MTTTAHDVAEFILRECGRISAMKLQKLLYYSQAWSIVWDGVPLFDDPIEAWDGGPVVGDVWRDDRDGRLASSCELTPAQAATVRGVLAFYAPFTGSELSEVTHRELPWLDARDEGRNAPIGPARLAAFYGQLPELQDCGKRLPESYRASLEMLLRMDPDEVAQLYEAMQSPIAYDEPTRSAELIDWLTTDP